MAKQCQSCGMPLKKDSDKGTEKNGELSETYCAMCYKDGKFVGGDCTPEQMQEIVEKALKEKGWPKPMRWMAKKQIPKLGRWKDK